MSALFGVHDLKIYAFDFYFEGYNFQQKGNKIYDKRVASTIIHLLLSWFKQRNQAIIYTCDATGNTPESRQGLFKRWHKLYDFGIEIENFSYVDDADEDDIIITIGGVLFRKDFEHRDFLKVALNDILPATLREKNGH